MEDRETPRMHKYGESKTTWILMATVRRVTSGAERTNFQADFCWTECTFESNFKARSHNHIWCAKAVLRILIVYMACYPARRIITFVALLHHIFPHSHTWCYFREIYLHKMFWFSLRVYISHSNKNSAIYYHKCT